MSGMWVFKKFVGCGMYGFSSIFSVYFVIIYRFFSRSTPPPKKKPNFSSHFSCPTMRDHTTFVVEIQDNFFHALRVIIISHTNYVEYF